MALTPRVPGSPFHVLEAAVREVRLSLPTAGRELHPDLVLKLRSPAGAHTLAEFWLCTRLFSGIVGQSWGPLQHATSTCSWVPFAYTQTCLGTVLQHHHLTNGL